MNPKLYASLLLVFFLFTNIGVFSREKEDVSEFILKGYASHLAPSFPVGVEFSLSYICSLFDQTTRILKSVIWESYMWQDDRLDWSSSNYSYNEPIGLPVSKIWHPDIRVYNSIRLSERDNDVSLIVYSSGTIIWVSPVIHHTLCSPASFGDNQSKAFYCRLKFSSWAYNADEVNITSSGNVDQSTYDSLNCAVMSNVTSTRNIMQYPCCEESFVDVTVSFIVEDNPN